MQEANLSRSLRVGVHYARFQFERRHLGFGDVNNSGKKLAVFSAITVRVLPDFVARGSSLGLICAKNYQMDVLNLLVCGDLNPKDQCLFIRVSSV